MTATIYQAFLLAIVSGVVLTLTVWLTRRGLLSLRFGVSWLLISCLMLLGALIGAVDLVRPLADALHVTPTGLIVGGLGVFLLGMSLHLSVALSTEDHASRRLAQELALLQQRVEELEAKRASKARQ